MRLEKFDESHLPFFAALFDDPEIQRFTLLPSNPPPDYAQTWYAGYEQGRLDGTRELFAVLEEEGELAGVGMAFRIDATGSSAELGYLVAPAERGRGIATETLRLLTEWGFTELGAQRLELRISTANTASKRVAERAGYAREGVLRSLYFKDGLRVDTEVWSRLPTD